MIQWHNLRNKIAILKKQKLKWTQVVSSENPFHNHILQTYPQHRAEKQKNDNSDNVNQNKTQLMQPAPLPRRDDQSK